MTNKRKIVTMGEIMLRLSPIGYNKIVQTEAFDIYCGGAEFNVAAGLANFGENVFHISQVPENALGDKVIRYAKGSGINTSYIVSKGDRLGLYFLEKGTSLRPSKVIYDRANSAISNADIEDFDFDSIFKDAYLFHVSGITPVLSDKCLNLTRKAIKSAKKYGVKISVDLNYRKKLCDYPTFNKIMKEIVKDSYICFGWVNKDNDECFKPVNYDGNIDYNYFKEAFEYMHKELNVENVITTLRKSISVSKNSLIGIGSNGTDIKTSEEYTFDIVDRVGAGDAFAAGVLHKLVNDFSFQDAMDFGIALSVFKHTILGDCNVADNIEEIEYIMNSTSLNIER